jgi:hypothetical protein
VSHDDHISTAYAVADLRAFLAGAWRLTRRLDDRGAGVSGVLDGEARFDADGAGLAYREDGDLRMAAYEGRVWRCYRYGFPAPHRAEVYFADGRAFHVLDLSRGHWTAEHACGADLYRGAFRVDGPDTWRATWRVRGPRKDLILRGVYRRGP